MSQALCWAPAMWSPDPPVLCKPCPSEQGFPPRWMEPSPPAQARGGCFDAACPAVLTVAGVIRVPQPGAAMGPLCPPCRCRPLHPPAAAFSTWLAQVSPSDGLSHFCLSGLGIHRGSVPLCWEQAGAVQPGARGIGKAQSMNEGGF